MGANKVDIVFVVDASESMKPCFDKLKQNLRRFILPLNQASFEVRLGLLAYHSMKVGSHIGHVNYFIGGDTTDKVTGLYNNVINDNDYFVVANGKK